MDDMTQKEREEFEDGCRKAHIFMQIAKEAREQSKTNHPYILAMRAVSYDFLTESEINEIEEGSVLDSVMSMADMALYKMSKAKEAMSSEAYQHMLNAVEGALNFAVYLCCLHTEEALGLSDCIAEGSIRKAIKDRASKAGKASKRRYIDEREKAISRYYELQKLPQFKNESRAGIARKIMGYDEITATERTICEWIKREIESKK
jgi:hypothetical protein